MRILVFSDLHVHPHKKSSERLDDCLEVLEWTFEVARKNDIKDIVFLGDLFHDRQKIDVLTYQKTFDVLHRNLCISTNEISLYLLLGNHDLWHYERLDVSSVNPLKTIRGVRVIDRPCVLDLGKGFRMGFLPYTHSPIEDIKKVEKEWGENKGERKVIGGHIAVDGALWNVMYNTTSDVSVEHEGDMVRVGPEIFSEWDRVFLGHYHAAQKLDDRVEYVGSPLQLSFGEAGQDKHLLIYDTEIDSISYVENEFSPKHIIIDESELDGSDLDGNFIRLEVSDITSSRVNEIREKIVTEGRASTLEIKQRKSDESNMVEDAKSIIKNQDNMIEKYVEQTAPRTLDRSLLVNIGMEICSLSGGDH